MSGEEKTPVELMAEALNAIPVPEYGRSPAMEVLPVPSREPVFDRLRVVDERMARALIIGPVDPGNSLSLKAGSVNYVSWAAPARPPNTAKNKRRAKFRWLAREARRNAGATALAATALPALAPVTTGTPGPVAFIRHRVMTASELMEYFGHPTIATPQDCRYLPYTSVNQGRPYLKSDAAAGFVPLPEKPRPAERPFVPRKLGEF